MAAEIRVPEMGESIIEATVGKWLKQPGDLVHVGEPVLELETEKVNLEVPSPQDGVLAERLMREGETVRVGEVLGTVADGATPQRPATAPPEQPETPARPPEGSQPGRNLPNKFRKRPKRKNGLRRWPEKWPRASRLTWPR
jgi:pyruvate/2-oxoglutarate dehydrogenase complex dihydrolipoamide acyltransferase (E2) component